MVFRTHVGLNALTESASTSPYVFASFVATDKGDGFDARFVADEVDRLRTTVNDIEDAVGKTSLSGELGDDQGSARDTLTGFEEECVPGGDGHGNAPKGTHSREVEGANGSTNTQGHPTVIRVHIFGHFEDVSFDELRCAHRIFDDLHATEDIPHSVSMRLAILLNDDIGQVTLVGADEFGKIGEDLLPGKDAGLAPLLEGRVGAIESLLQLFCSGLRCLGDQLLRRWIMHIEERTGGALYELAMDVIGQCNGRLGAFKACKERVLTHSAR